PIEIARLQRRAMDHFYDHGAKLPVTAAPKAGKIACIGSGPASLACAAELSRRGYTVTVFDRNPLAGGLNTYGIAEYKLRPVDSLKEVELVKSLGVEFRQGVQIDTSFALDKLESDYDAIFLGVGLGQTHRLGIPGDDLPGVVD